MIEILRPPARLAARLIALLLLIALAIAGAAVAVFSIQGGVETLSLPNLASLIGLPVLRDSTAELLEAVEADGPIALVSALAGLAAILVGLLLLIGALARPSERLFRADDSPEGRIAARPRPLATAAAELARGTDGVTGADARAKPSRSGGRLSVKAVHRHGDADELRGRVDSALASLRSAFALRTRVSIEDGGKGSRVE